MSQVIQAGVSSKSIDIFIADSTTGQGKTGLTAASFTKFGISFQGAAVVDVTSSLSDLSTYTSSYAANGFKEKDATKDPGWYRYDIPNAQLAANAHGRITYKGTGILDSGSEDSCQLDIVAYDPTTIDKTGFSLASGGMDAVPGYV